MAEGSKGLSKIQVERMPLVPGLNPAVDYNIDRSELEIYFAWRFLHCMDDVCFQPLKRKVDGATDFCIQSGHSKANPLGVGNIARTCWLLF